MGIIVVVSILSGFVDFYFSDWLKTKTFSKSEKHLPGIKKNFCQGLGWQIVMSFSLYSNISSIFDVSEANKVHLKKMNESALLVQ